MIIKCPNCGKEFRNLNELSNIRGLGLALIGECPKCGIKIGCNSLWKVTRRLKEIEQ